MIILKDGETLIYVNSPLIDLYFQYLSYQNSAIFPMEIDKLIPKSICKSKILGITNTFLKKKII